MPQQALGKTVTFNDTVSVPTKLPDGSIKPTSRTESRTIYISSAGRMFVRKTRLFERMREFMQRYAFYVLPTTQVMPFDAALRAPADVLGVESTTYIDWMRVCWLLSSTEAPILSVPCGFSEAGLPIGMQIVGRHRDDWGVLQFGHAYEVAAGRRWTPPPVVADALR